MATMYGGHSGGVAASETRSLKRSSRSTRRCRSHRQAADLDLIVQGEIIPRLLTAHRAPRLSPSTQAGAQPISAEEVADFAQLPLTLEAEELLQRVEAIIDRGIGVESIFIELLAPSARRLGQFWEDDICDFVDVTMGLWRLQEVMREIAMRSPAITKAISAPRSALFSPLPGEQHSFGALMVEEVFARAGWATEALIESRRQELLRVVADRSFDLVGLTVSCDCPSGALSDLITAIRSVSRNPAVQIFIGGRVVNANPGLAVEVGADATAPDACSALAIAERKVPGPRLLDLATL